MLLQCVGGIYAPLLAGGCALLPPLGAVGMKRDFHGEAGMLLTALWAHEPTTIMLTHEMLAGLLATLETGLKAPASLRFVAVSGAPLADSLLDRAERAELPVFEAYGLTECASLVAVNTVYARKRGSVGKPLPHARVSIASDGEVLVKGATLLGYAGQSGKVPSPWPTGDVGHLDQEGYLYIAGRKTSMLDNALERKLAPERVEQELSVHSAIAQAAVFGQGRPWNIAIVVPEGQFEPAAIEAAVAEVNAKLPDYARVGAWLLADAPFNRENGQLSANGQLRRDTIRTSYAERIDQLYQGDAQGVF
jgi:long-chain acyl-CoA synthetase